MNGFAQTFQEVTQGQISDKKFLMSRQHSSWEREIEREREREREM